MTITAKSWPPWISPNAVSRTSFRTKPIWAQSKQPTAQAGATGLVRLRGSGCEKGVKDSCADGAVRAAKRYYSRATGN